MFQWLIFYQIMQLVGVRYLRDGLRMLISGGSGTCPATMDEKMEAVCWDGVAC